MTARAIRRATKLATPLVAAGLALSAVPHAVAATGQNDPSGTDGQAMTLTDKQAAALANGLNVDVYGDQAPTVGEQSTAAAPEDTSGPVTFTNTATLEGVRGLGATVPAKGSNYFTVHSLGEIQLHKADGSTVWARTNPSLYADWGITNLRPWNKEMYPAHVLMGYNAVSPFSPYSDQGYDSSDLTGDGVPDLVFSASVGMLPPTGVRIPGTTMTEGTVVTVLDGTTGKTLWSKVYAYANLVKIVDGTLLVADSPRQNGYSLGTETATLSGTRFAYADGALTPSSTWTYDTGLTEPVTWGAIEELGNGRVAASWSLRKTSDTAAHGTTLVLDTADGSTVWTSESDLYGRQLHLDAARGRLVALEQSDVSDGVEYQVAAYDLATGERTTLDTRVNAMPTAMTIGDAAKGGGTEYVVNESTATDTPRPYVTSSTLRVLSGKDGATTEWTHTVKRDPANTHDGASVWELTTVGGRLVASSQDDSAFNDAVNTGGLQYGTLTVFNPKGAVAWQQAGLDASPMYHQLYRSGGNDFVRTVDQNQNIHEYKLGNGTQKSLTPLQGDLSYGQATDLNGDRKPDVIAGGNSDGVWAWSGPSLVKGTPQQLWRATVPGQVHDLTTGDVNGDGKPEIVVAADTATVVLDGATGNVLTTIDGNGQYVRSVTVADTNGDGKDEILVPTDALRAYSARGKLLWTYAAPAGSGDVLFSNTVVADGRVYTQYGSVNGLQRSDAVAGAVAIDGGSGNVLWEKSPEVPDIAADGKVHGAVLDNGVFASPEIPYADGHAVVHTWLMQSPVPGHPDTAVTPHVFIEIRDGRTGELLHQSLGGSPWSHDNYLTSDNVLYELSFGVFHRVAPDGEDSSVAAGLRSAQLIRGPGGRALVGGGIDGGLAVYDKSLLASGALWASSVGGVTLTGGRNCLVADLDGDGVDEMISLNYDDFGVNRTDELLGGGAFFLDDGVHQMSVFKLS